MLMSLAFAIATMIAVLASQTLLKLVQAPLPLRRHRAEPQRRSDNS
jgi:hypothetical protein